MDAMDILGALLGKKAGSGSPGGSVLKDMLGRRPAPSQAPSQPRQHPQARRPQTIDQAAKSLEELLGVSNDHHRARRETRRPQTPAPAPPSSPRAPSRSWSPQEQEAMNEQAKILVAAMVSAAKADGQVSPDEQAKITEKLDHVTQEEVDFVRSEFSKPLDVRGLAWSVPLGMEEQAYTISLIAIDLDDQKEANYLADLAHGLRLSPARCNEIHTRYGAPVIFKA